MCIATLAARRLQFVCCDRMPRFASKFAIAAEVYPQESNSSLSGIGTMGVGLRGMRERILQLGGNLNVQSNAGGTTIVATFPITATAETSNRETVVA